MFTLSAAAAVQYKSISVCKESSSLQHSVITFTYTVMEMMGHKGKRGRWNMKTSTPPTGYVNAIIKRHVNERPGPLPFPITREWKTEESENKKARNS